MRTAIWLDLKSYWKAARWPVLVWALLVVGSMVMEKLPAKHRWELSFSLSDNKEKSSPFVAAEITTTKHVESSDQGKTVVSTTTTARTSSNSNIPSLPLIVFALLVVTLRKDRGIGAESYGLLPFARPEQAYLRLNVRLILVLLVLALKGIAFFYLPVSSSAQQALAFVLIFTATMGLVDIASDYFSQQIATAVGSIFFIGVLYIWGGGVFKLVLWLKENANEKISVDDITNSASYHLLQQLSANILIACALIGIAAAVASIYTYQGRKQVLER